jgi:hypothetical protein
MSQDFDEMQQAQVGAKSDSGSLCQLKHPNTFRTHLLQSLPTLHE